jgi:DNA modification methylase
MQHLIGTLCTLGGAWLVSVEGDIVLDPFAGSNTTGAVCERLNRRWLAFDQVDEYVTGGRFRFDDSELV